MISCHRAHLETRCRERGYTLDEVMPCVVSQDGDTWRIDVDHPAYPRTPKPGREPTLAATAPTFGPGTELKKLLAGWPFYITSSPDCSCNAMAAKMDAMGCEWCESPEGMAEILAAMKSNAEKRGIPYIEAAAKLLVKRAIHKARKATIQ